MITSAQVRIVQKIRKACQRQFMASMPVRIMYHQLLTGTTAVAAAVALLLLLRLVADYSELVNDNSRAAFVKRG